MVWAEQALSGAAICFNDHVSFLSSLSEICGNSALGKKLLMGGNGVFGI